MYYAASDLKVAYDKLIDAFQSYNRQELKPLVNQCENNMVLQ